MKEISKQEFHEAMMNYTKELAEMEWREDHYRSAMRRKVERTSLIGHISK